MLEPCLQFLNEKRIVLASGSPRRKELLEILGLKFTCQDSGYDESELDPSTFPVKSDYAMKLAVNKVKHLKYDESETPYLIIGADTIVICEDEILGKPHSEAHAAETLRKLRGKTHQVVTGVALYWGSKNNQSVSLTEESFLSSDRTIDSFFTETKVIMKDYSDEDITAYVKTGEPMDKAGAYGIQGVGGELVEDIMGDFHNVVGLPVLDLCSRIRMRLK